MPQGVGVADQQGNLIKLRLFLVKLLDDAVEMLLDDGLLLREKIQLGLGQLEEIHPVLDLDLIDVELFKQCFLNQHGYLMSPGRVPGDGDYRLLLVIAWWKPASTDAHGPAKCVE